MIPFTRTIGLALGEVRANRLRSILMILCVAAAVATTTIVNQMAASAEQDIRATITRTQGVRGTIEAMVPDLSLSEQLEVLSPQAHGFADGRAIDLGMVSLQATADSKEQSWEVHAMDPGILGTFPNDLVAGRWLKVSDAAHPVVPVVISVRVAEDLMAGAGGRGVVVGQVLTFDFPVPVLMQVVGVLDQGVLSHRWDGIIVPLDEGGFPVALRDWVYRAENIGGAVRLYSNEPTAPEKHVALVSQKVTATLESRGLGTQSVQVMRVDSAEEFEKATKTLNTILTSIGMAVLLIGMTAVAIVSMMSLRERAGELALRRAMGATPRSISVLVLWENLVVVLLGAVAGISGSVGVAAVLSQTSFGGMAGGFNQIQPLVAVATLGATVLTGIILSLLPARRASKQDIMDVLVS